MGLFGTLKLSSKSSRKMTKSTENPIGSTLQQTMLRIKDPKISISFYCDHFGFKLLHKYDFPDWKFSLYFLGILKEGQDWPEIEDTKATEKALWTMPHGMSCLELTHNCTVSYLRTQTATSIFMNFFIHDF